MFNPEPNATQTRSQRAASSAFAASSRTISKACRHFLVAGFLFVLTGPIADARSASCCTVSSVARLLHFAAYLGARDHETRATFWSLSSLVLVFITGWTLVAALAS
jgi:hypothetical protein